MKHRSVLSIGLFVFLSAPVMAGPLAPPAGPIAPTHKTLTEIEPRVPVGPSTTPGDASVVYRISTPGSYHLVGDVLPAAGKDGIEIACDNVTLDLNGFSVIGPEGLGGTPGSKGIVLFKLDGVPTALGLRNGIVRGFAYGVFGSARHGEFSDLVIYDNNAGGLELGDAEGCRFSDLRVDSPAEAGIVAGTNAVVEDCVVRGGNIGISLLGNGTVRNCAVSGSTTGIESVSGGVVTGCSVSECEVGIRASGGALVESCSVQTCAKVGVEVSFGASVRQSNIQSCPVGVGDSAIFIARATIDSNSFALCPIGVKLLQSGSTVMRNVFHQSTTAAVQVAAGNSVGTVVASPVGAGAWDNLSN